MLWLLFPLLPSCLALICFNCGDYMGSRSVCSATTSCTGTRCLIVHLNNSTSFASDCYVAPTQTEDFCWTDSFNRTLCSCKTKFCNSPTAVENLTVSQANLLPEVSIDTMLATIGATTPVVGTAATGITGETVPPAATGETLSPATGDTSASGVPVVITAAPTGEETTTAAGGSEGTPIPVTAHDVPSQDNSTSTPVQTTTKLGSLYRTPLVVLVASLLL